MNTNRAKLFQRHYFSINEGLDDKYKLNVKVLDKCTKNIKSEHLTHLSHIKTQYKEIIVLLIFM